MKSNEPRLFYSDISKMPNCGLFQPGIPPEMTFRVTKLDWKLEARLQYYVYSSSEISFGHLDCRPGTIDAINIRLAQQCGIGTILTGLCMNEDKIHDVKAKNPNHLGVQALGRKNRKTKAWIKSHCSKFVMMEVNTPTVLNAFDPALFFELAKRNGFTIMVVKIENGKENEEMYPKAGPCSTEEFAENFKSNDRGLHMNFDGPSVWVTGPSTQWYFCFPKKNIVPKTCEKA